MEKIFIGVCRLVLHPPCAKTARELKLQMSNSERHGAPVAAASWLRRHVAAGRDPVRQRQSCGLSARREMHPRRMAGSRPARAGLPMPPALPEGAGCCTPKEGCPGQAGDHREALAAQPTLFSGWDRSASADPGDMGSLSLAVWRDAQSL